MSGLANPAYNDNNVPYGSRTESLKRGQTSPTTLGTYILENITINRPVAEIDRTDQVGGPNGWVAVNKQEDGSVTVQYASTSATWPQNGDWFQDTFDPNIGVEKFVLINLGIPFEINGYFKVNAKLKKAYYT